MSSVHGTNDYEALKIIAQKASAEMIVKLATTSPLPHG